MRPADAPHSSAARIVPTRNRHFPSATRPTMVRAMTMPGAISAAEAHAPAGSRVWRAEMTETVKLALPIALTQLGQIAMMTSDLALIGRLGDQAVAAAALAHTVLFTMFVHRHGHRVRRSRRLPRKPSVRASRAWCAARCASALWAAGDPRRAAHLGAVVGRRTAGRARAVARERGARGALSARHGVVPGAGLDLHGAAQLHERGEPAGARALDHARGDPGQCACSPMR